MAAAHSSDTAVVFSVVAGIVFVLASVRSRLLREQDPAGAHRTTLELAIVVASLLAAVIHGWVIDEHIDESAIFGAFFIDVTLAQAAYALAVMFRPGRALLLAGAVGNAAVVLLWVVSRTVGIPIGPEAGEAEAVGALDVVATAAEVVVVLAACWCLRQAAMSRTATGSRASTSFDIQTPSMASASATMDESR